MSLTISINSDKNIRPYLNIFKYYSITIYELKNLYKKLNNDFPVVDTHTRLIAARLAVNSKRIIGDVLEFLKDQENMPYLLIPLGKENLSKRLDRLALEANYANTKKLTTKRLMDQFSRMLNNFIVWFDYFKDYVEREKESTKLIESLKTNVQEAKAQAKNFETAIQALNSQESEVIYTSASKNFLNRARNYEILFYLILGGSILFTTVHLCYVPYEKNELTFVLAKILTFSVVLTLGTIFLRKAAHFRKLYDQTHQTSLELKALPLYLKNVDKIHHSDIYKELANKYFGKDIDPSQNDKVGDLLQDQIKAGTELVRASAEMVKSVKSNNQNAEK